MIRRFINRNPKADLLSRISLLQAQRERLSLSPQTNGVTPASRDDLEQTFKVDSVRRSLFPSGVLVRDSQSFGVEERFADFNIPLILADRLAAMFATRHDVSKELTSLSFGTALESSVSRKILRYVIDYYGPADVDVIKRHVLEHLLEVLPGCVRASEPSDVVCLVLFLPDFTYEAIDFEEVRGFVSEVCGFGRCEDTHEEQCYGYIPIMQYFQRFSNSKL